MADLPQDERFSPEWKLPFKPKTIAFFSKGGVGFTDSDLHVDYTYNHKTVAREYFGGIHHTIPATPGIWVLSDAHPLTVRTCVLFTSVVEAMCFTQVKGLYNRDSLNTVIVSTGLRPGRSQILRLSEEYPNAKYQLAFGNDILGRIMDCAVAAWLLKVEAGFLLTGSSVEVVLEGKARYVFETERLSLSLFQKTCGIRSSIRTRKPPLKHLSFKQMLLSNH